MRRSCFEIISEMLQTAKNGATTTRIRSKCNLNHHQAKKLLSYLLESGLLMEGNSFHTTERGMIFVQYFQTLEHFLKPKCSGTRNMDSYKQLHVIDHERFSKEVE